MKEITLKDLERAMEEFRKLEKSTENVNDLILSEVEHPFMPTGKQAVESLSGRFGWYDKETGKGFLMPKHDPFNWLDPLPVREPMSFIAPTKSQP